MKAENLTNILNSFLLIFPFLLNFLLIFPHYSPYISYLTSYYTSVLGLDLEGTTKVHLLTSASVRSSLLNPHMVWKYLQYEVSDDQTTPCHTPVVLKSVPL